MDDVGDKEDVLANKFFRILQSAFEPLYALAQKNCWLICVPCSWSLSGMRITPEFVETHILKPSPLFQGLFEVFNNDRKTCEIEAKVITTTRGFPKVRKSRILSEELFYNKDFKPFRVVILSKPLIGKILKKKDGVKQIELPPIRDPSKCIAFLSSFPEDEIVLRKIDQYIDNFKETYVVVKGFENDARVKVEKLVEFATDQLLAANIDFRRMQTNPRQLREISLVIETYVMVNLYQKLMLGLRAVYEEEDASFASITAQVKVKSLSTFGVPQSIASTDLSSAIKMLDLLLEEAQAPIQILFAFHDTVEEVGRAIDAYNKLQKSNKGSEPITTDDLIPILVWLVSQSNFKFFESALVYAETFLIADFSNSKYGFNLINFKAAICYLKSDGLSLLNDPEPKVSASPVVTTVLSSGSQEFKFQIGGSPAKQAMRRNDAKPETSLPVKAVASSAKQSTPPVKQSSSPQYMISPYNVSGMVFETNKHQRFNSPPSSTSPVDPQRKDRSNSEAYKRPPRIIEVDNASEGRLFNTNSTQSSADLNKPSSPTNGRLASTSVSAGTTAPADSKGGLFGYFK